MDVVNMRVDVQALSEPLQQVAPEVFQELEAAAERLCLQQDSVAADGVAADGVAVEGVAADGVHTQRTETASDDAGADGIAIGTLPDLKLGVSVGDTPLPDVGRSDDVKTSPGAEG